MPNPKLPNLFHATFRMGNLLMFFSEPESTRMPCSVGRTPICLADSLLA